MNRNQYELYHYGVKGMKWGVRRYVNSDGSLTDKGKKRYKNANDKIVNAKTYTKRQLNALPRKERKATKKYLKETQKSYRMDAKNQYKKLGGKRGLRMIEPSSNGNLINTKTGKKVSPSDYVKATRYRDLYRTSTPERVQKGIAFVTTSASIAGILAGSYTLLDLYK